jgi:undecaprenyl-diphosphatase
LFRWIKIPLLLWALAISYAQVYVGVHYPVDVVAGALLGCLVGAWMHGATRFYFRKEAADFYQT